MQRHTHLLDYVFTSNWMSYIAMMTVIVLLKFMSANKTEGVTFFKWSLRIFRLQYRIYIRDIYFKIKYAPAFEPFVCFRANICVCLSWHTNAKFKMFRGFSWRLFRLCATEILWRFAITQANKCVPENTNAYELVLFFSNAMPYKSNVFLIFKLVLRVCAIRNNERTDARSYSLVFKQ